ncbi:ketosynthase chain-length factor [Streptomyces flaveolus]|uniref:ketosynthase chain-length factor n=1 Tax=Streptomyces flaveolus TaxID=67297 RepID=UPI0034314EAB
MNARPVAAAVTGLGVAAPNGLGTDTWWRAVLAGQSGIRPVSRFDAAQYPARLAGEVPGFEAAEHVPARLLPQTDHMTRLALAVAEEALSDAGAKPTGDGYDTGIVTASSVGGFEFGQRELQALWSKGGRYVSAYQSFAWFYAVNTGQISIAQGMRGPGGVLVTEQAGGLDAVAEARRRLRRGTRRMLSGGVDSALCPWGWAGYLADGRLCTSDDPARAFLPYSAHASGQVIGEGGALLVLEDAAHAEHSYGEIAGHAATFDPPSGPSRLRAAAELALADSRVAPADVDVVFGDAAGVRADDVAEAEALAGIFGPYGVPVTAPKTMTGRLSAGAASLDLAAALLALRDQVIPPTVHVGSVADDCPVDLVTGAPRPARLRTALVLARGRGGFNSAMVVRAPAGHRRGPSHRREEPR